MKPVDLFHSTPQHRDRARRRGEDESEPEASGKLDLPAEYLPFGFGCRVEDAFVSVHGQSGGRRHRSLMLLRMGTASADVFSLGANGLPGPRDEHRITPLPYSTVNGGAFAISPRAFNRAAIRPKMPARKNFITTITRVANSSMCA